MNDRFVTPAHCDLPAWAAQIAADRQLSEWSRTHLLTLTDALDGLALDGPEASIVAWLAGWDAPTVDAIASIVRRCRTQTP